MTQPLNINISIINNADFFYLTSQLIIVFSMLSYKCLVFTKCFYTWVFTLSLAKIQGRIASFIALDFQKGKTRRIQGLSGNYTTVKIQIFFS
jgi:hypothetical protein